MPTIFWFTRDLRLQDNGALARAIADSKDGEVLACYLLPVAEFEELSGIRQHSLLKSLEALRDSLAGNLTVIEVVNHAQSGQALAKLAHDTGANRVFATRMHDHKSKKQQFQVGSALAKQGVELFLEDSMYAVPPGSVLKGDGTPYRVYTPFFKAWMAAGWDSPISIDSNNAKWLSARQPTYWPKVTKSSPIEIKAGEGYALATWERFKTRALNKYDSQRDRADLSGTSHLSHALAHGEIHPRTLLAQLGDSPAEEVFRKELAWREFYADVLWNNPHSSHDYYATRFAQMRYDSGPEAAEKLISWQQGKTGYPMVDAGMRQLLTTGWVHNRVRMIVASFLVKDLHLEWQVGANWFEQNLTDFDVASNSHGWQWTAGCGTDASPYYRVFNPVSQGLKFDPNGDYVRKYIPELRHLGGSAVHEPWNHPAGYSQGYATPIVDHAVERLEALARLKEIQ